MDLINHEKITLIIYEKYFIFNFADKFKVNRSNTFKKVRTFNDK